MLDIMILQVLRLSENVTGSERNCYDFSRKVDFYNFSFYEIKIIFKCIDTRYWDFGSLTFIREDYEHEKTFLRFFT